MKYIITGLHSSGKQEVIDILKAQGVKCGRNFANLDIQTPNIYNSLNYDIYDVTEIDKIFENKAYIFIQELIEKDGTKTHKYFEGLAQHEFDTNQVFVMSPDQLLAIPTSKLADFINDDEICIVWMDSNKASRIDRYKMENRSYQFKDREEQEFYNIPLYADRIMSFGKNQIIYFASEEPGRVACVIMAHLKGDEQMRKMIHEYYR